MTEQEIHLIAMPYVAGTVRGALQWGMHSDVTGRIVVLDHVDTAKFVTLPAGFIVIEGAPLSHAMVPLLGTGVPTVIVRADQASSLEDGAEVALDGETGVVTSRTGSSVKLQQGGIGVESKVTPDGVTVHLRASARNDAAAQRAVTSGAEAIGLVRTEFFTPDDGSIPDAEFYRHAFRALCEAAAPLPVTFRLADIAVDKLPAWLPRLNGVDSVLGLQGVRLYAHEPMRSVYRAQLAVLDELSTHFDLRVLIPYVTGYEELQYWVEDVRQRLSGPIAIGVMAETPAATLQIADWLRVADFSAVGCNDLMQCLFGANRDRPELSEYLDPWSPSLYRFMRLIAAAAQHQTQYIQLCGVLPQLPGILPILLGLGYRIFSVEAVMLPRLRRTIAATTMSEARLLAEHVCDARGSREVRKLLGKSRAHR